MRIAGQVAAETHEYLATLTQPGITTLELDKAAESFIRSKGCIPACLNYQGFPNTMCVSVNDEVVHCVPNTRPLQDGDIVTFDFGAIYDGFYSDTAKTYLVGNVSDARKKFTQVCYDSLWKGIEQVKDGGSILDISKAIQYYIDSHNYGVVKEYVGHGIGRNIHEEPKIPNWFKEGTPNPKLTAGMVICIEPIITERKNPEVTKHSEWDIRTTHGDWAAHFEHTIAILPTGYEVLTLRSEEPHARTGNG